ncbi:Trypanosomal VSG domain containing protein [Trypanosoma brucei equiperdum]|uniref:Trypanosomal VSG domain containing protein n=1 Tax=Trypanosoma brucei equiperdum TaxID=630700 RepID=A0A3L6KQY2_9TRYP|nr:Trypanosomal VSG domain containing protein [Trypanosoma brucei equiperdum]
MLCLCFGNAGGNTIDCKQNNIECHWSSNVLAHVNLETAQCPNRKPTAVTYSMLAELIATIKSRMRVSAKTNALVRHLGKEPTTCDGTTTKLCVIYTATTTTGDAGSGLNAIPWVAKLIEAQRTMEEMQTLAVKASKQAAAMEMLIEAAKTAYAVQTVQLLEKQDFIAGTDGKDRAAKPETTNNGTCKAKGVGTSCKYGCKEISENSEKKCVVDPTYTPKQVNGAHQDSTTGNMNTTGSHSFVINRPPLLLACLLLA